MIGTQKYYALANENIKYFNSLYFNYLSLPVSEIFYEFFDLLNEMVLI